MSVYSNDHLSKYDGAEIIRSHSDSIPSTFGMWASLAIMLLALILLGISYLRRTKANGNRLVIIGGGVAAASLLMTDGQYGSGIIANVMNGAEILDSGIETRWPLLAAAILIFGGLLVRFGMDETDSTDG